MDKQPVGQLPDLTQSNNDNEIMVITDSEHNQLKKEKISDFITDLTSTDENNAIVKGTDGKLFTKDFGDASNITEGTLPTSVLPDIPKSKLPPIETSDLPVSGVSADTYAYPSSVTVNAQGMVTAIEEGSPSGANANTDLSNITDAGKEVIKENSAGQPIGSLFWSFATADYVPEYALPCDGTEYSNAMFTGLWNNYLTAETPKLLTKNYTQYQADITEYGSCAAFGVEHSISAVHSGTTITEVAVTTATWEGKVTDVGEYVFSYDGTNWSLNSEVVALADYGVILTGEAGAGDTVTVTYAFGTHFKVPTIKDGTFVQQAMSNGELGKAYKAGLPNLTGKTGASSIGNRFPCDGVFAYRNDMGQWQYGVSGGGYGDVVYMDASKQNSIYGSSSTVQPNAVALRCFVVVANTSDNESAMDWSEWASSLNGKLNADHSNDTKPYITETYRNGNSGYVVYSNGLCEQWGMDVSTTNPVVVTLLKEMNTKYNVQITSAWAIAGVSKDAQFGEKYSDSFKVYKQDINASFCWFIKGYTE